MEVADCSASQKVNPLTVKLDILTLLSRQVTAKLQYSICLFPYFSIKGMEFGPLDYTSSTWNEKLKLTLNSWAWITFLSAFGNMQRLLPSSSPEVPPCWPLSPVRLWQGYSPCTGYYCCCFPPPHHPLSLPLAMPRFSCPRAAPQPWSWAKAPSLTGTEHIYHSKSRQSLQPRSWARRFFVLLLIHKSLPN